MECVEGMNLEEWVKQHGKVRDESKAFDWLSQLVKILGLIHAKDLLHRDIKPSNIMLRANVVRDELVLIDFGAAKRSETIVNSQDPTRFGGSLGYTPLEVQQGQPMPQSDLFALGRTFVYLLTGKHPHTDQLDLKVWEWQSEFPQSKLIELIASLMQEQPSDRPQSAKEVLRKIDEIRNIEPSPPPPPGGSKLPPRQLPTWLPWLAGAGGVGGVVLLTILIMLNIRLVQCGLLRGLFAQTCGSSINSESRAKSVVSSGEKPLLDPKLLNLTSPYKEWKQDGIKMFAAAAAAAGKKDYQAAIDKLQLVRQKAKEVLDEETSNKNISEADRGAARNALRDAEVLIYLNNARARQSVEKGGDIPTIAVAVPLNLNEGLHILQGVAQAQNNLGKGKYLEVVIADDNNDEERAKNVAAELGQNRKILAVVGHYTSEVTRAAMSEYQKKDNGLIVISPTSTSARLTRDFGAGGQFFRTASSTSVEGDSLAKYTKARRVAVFRSEKEFSVSLAEEFIKKMGTDRIVGPYDLDQDSVNKLDQAEIKQADSIAVFPDGQTARSGGFGAAINVIKKYLKQNNEKEILGANSLFLWNTLNSNITEDDLKQSIVCRLIIGVDWFFSSSTQDIFSKNAASSNYWGGQINFRTALANDAVQAFVAAWQPDWQRSNIQQKLLSSSNQLFRVMDTGYGEVATGEGTVSFSPSGERNELRERILVTPDLTSGGDLTFVPLRNNADCPQ